MHEEKETEESEKPINPGDAMKKLDEKIALVKERGTWDGVDVDKYMDEVRGREPEKPMNLEGEINRYLREECSDDDEPGIHEIAEHFAKWGYLRAAEKYDEIEYNRQRAEDSVPNDLEEAAWGYASKECEKDAFKAGAKWQAEQFEQNRLAACDNQTKEEYDREMDFADEIINKEHRQPTFSDAINYGMMKMKEQMMKEAVEGEAHPDDCEIWVNLVGYGYDFKDGDKVRIIIVKE
jgi:hypothetical protein